MPTYFRFGIGPFRLSPTDVVPDRPVRQEGVMFRRFAVAVFGVVLALGSASAASAHVNCASSAPLVTFFPSPLPLVGTRCRYSTDKPSD